MATDVYYGQIQLHNVLTRTWDQETVMDESGTDALFTRIRIRVEGILHAQGQIGGGSGQANAPAWIGLNGALPNDLAGGLPEIRSRLWYPRQQLVVKLDSREVLTVDPCGQTSRWRDVDNGPKPKMVSIVHVVGSQLLRLAFEVEAAILLCPPGTSCSTNIPDVLNNRWSIQETMDDRYFTTRTIKGRLRLSNPNVNAEAYRMATIPGLEAGFKRDRIEFVTNASGLEADYTITDRQVTQSAPWPAAKIEGTHSSSTSDGLSMVDECSVTLYGHPGADKAQLLVRALQVVENRMGDLTNLNTAPKDGKAFRVVENAAFSTSLGEQNSVSASLRIRTTLGQNVNPTSFANLPLAKLDAPLELPPLEGVAYDSKISLSPQPYGYNSQGGDKGRNPAAALFLLKCALQSPCDGGPHSIGGTNGGSPSGEKPKDYTQVDGYQSPSVSLPSSSGDDLSDEHKASPYTICTAESTLFDTECVLQLPLSQEASDGSTCVTVTLAPAQARMETIVEHERVGKLPEIPRPRREITTPTGLKARLLRHWLRVQPPATLPGCSGVVYRVAAYYLYAWNRMPRDDEKLSLRKLPATSFSDQITSLTLNDMYEKA